MLKLTLIRLLVTTNKATATTTFNICVKNKMMISTDLLSDNIFVRM